MKRRERWSAVKESVAHAEAKRREAEAHYALLDTLSIEAADRAAALRLRRAPVWPVTEREGADDEGLDAYTSAFLGANGRLRRLDDIFHLSLTEESRGEVHGAEGFIVVATDHLGWFGVRPGSPIVHEFPPGARCAPSIAHLILQLDLGDVEEVIGAIAAAPTAWLPEPDQELFHYDLDAPAGESIALDTRSRISTHFYPLVLWLGGLGFSAAGISVALEGRLVALLPLGIGLAFVILGGLPLWHVLSVERRARALQPDAFGLLDPSDGKRIAWQRVRAMRRTEKGFQLELPSGRSVLLPDSLFASAEAAENFLSARVGRDTQGPYRES